MRFPLIFITTLLFLSNIGAAGAADATRLAETGAFLLGNAYRCNVPAERVSHAGRIIQDLIVAASADAGEQKSATSRFAEVFVASAYPSPDHNSLIPPCKAVITQFERLEQHHQQAGLN